MHLNVRVDVNFVSIDVNCDLIPLHFLILIFFEHQGPTNDPCKISANLEKK